MPARSSPTCTISHAPPTHTFFQGFARKASFYSSVAQLPDKEREAALADLDGSRRNTFDRTNRLSIRTAEDLESRNWNLLPHVAPKHHLLALELVCYAIKLCVIVIEC